MQKIKNNKFSIKYIITFFALVVILATSVVFAYFVQHFNGWGQKISSTTIVFSLNDKYINSVTNYDLNLLNKGDNCDLNFGVSMTSGVAQSGVGQFTLALTLNDGNTILNTTSENGSELARAIEVYKYINGHYEYVSMLNDFKSIVGEVPIEVTSTTATIVNNFKYKLVYSKTAGTYYQNKTFTLNVSATSKVVSQSSDNYFVSSSLNLKNALLDSSINNKNIILEKDLTLDSGSNDSVIIKSNNRVGIDLNGHTLTLTNTNVNFTSLTGDVNSSKLGIKDSIGTGSIGGNGNIIYSTPSDAPFIQDSLDTTSLSKIQVNNFSKDILTSKIQSAINEYSKKTLFANSAVNFLNGYSYYFNNLGTNNLTIAYDSSSILDSSNNISSSYNEQDTKINNFNATISFPDSTTKTLTFNLKVRGNSINAICDYELSKVPSIISGNVYLENYDYVSNATITWVSNDNSLLTSSGNYLINGIDSFTDWNNKSFSLCCIISRDGEKYSKTITPYVMILSAEGRTEKSYLFGQIILSELNSVYNVKTSKFNSTVLPLANLTGISIAIPDSTQNLNSFGENYIKIVQNETNFDSISIVNLPNAGNSVSIDAVFTFSYNNGVSVMTYSINQVIKVVGLAATNELSDLKGALQPSFTDNDYISGNSYEFTVKGYSKKGIFVDYVTTPACENYVIVQNDIWQQNDSGSFLKIGDNYNYFSTRYNLVDGAYVEASDGAYILINSNPYSYADAITNKTIYDRVAKFTILPNKVPKAETTEATILAKIWKVKDSNGNKTYLVDSNNNLICYDLTLVVKGIYHNNSDEIEDYNLYKKLLSYYDGTIDGKKDGYIEVVEAKCSFSAITGLTSVTISGTSYSYLDFSKLNINSLKGIEYFINAAGINFSDNNIVDISYLSKLHKLNYVNGFDNYVVDISALEFLDSLKYINFGNGGVSTGNNDIQSIEPLRYLKNVNNLYLDYNNNISDFSPLINYLNVKTISVLQANNIYTNTNNVLYQFTIILANNPTSNLSVLLGSNGAIQFTATDEEKVAAKALSNLVTAGEAYDTLFAPGLYTLNGKTYYLLWSTDVSDENYLRFISYYNTNDSTDVNNDKYTIGYEINTPLVDRKIKISVAVTKSTDGTNTTGYQMSNVFTLTLNKSQGVSSSTYIQTGTNTFISAETAIPDTNLRSLIFESFNTNITDDEVVSGNTTYTNKNTITLDEISSNAYTEFNFSNANITDLTGLRYFVSGFDCILDLRGNSLTNANISELSYLTSLKGLRLNGQDYNYNQLLTFDSDGNVNGGISSLTKLYVYGSYNLTNYTTLSGLYKVYLHNSNISIYKDNNTTIWNPYAKILENLSSSLDNVIFLNYNETYNFFTSGDYFNVDVYGITQRVYITSQGLEGSMSSNITLSESNVTYLSNTISALTSFKASAIFSYPDNIYLRYKLSLYDGVRTDMNYSNVIEILVDIPNNIIVSDLSNASLKSLFSGRSLRTAVLSSLTTLFNDSTKNAASVSGIDNATYYYYFDSTNNIYYINKATLSNLFASDYTLTDSGVVDFSGISLQNLRLTNIKNVYIIHDANLGTGYDLYNLTSLRIDNSVINFNTLTQDLPNLQTLICGAQPNEKSEVDNANNIQAILYNSDSYPLSHLTGIVDLELLNCNIYDWTGLTGLTQITNLGLKVLKIYSSTLQYSNYNSNTAASVAIISQIYNNSTATDKTYYIGSFHDNYNLSTIYTPETWTIQETLSTSLIQTGIDEYKKYASSIQEVGAKIIRSGDSTSNEYLWNTTDSSVYVGDKIYLPKGTSDLYGATYGDNTSNDYHNFAIKWNVYSSRTTSSLLSTFNGLFTDTNSSVDAYTFVSTVATTINLQKATINSSNQDLTLVTKQSTYDYYIIFEGEIGGGYYDSNDNYVPYSSEDSTIASSLTHYGFVYPVLVRASSTTSVNATNMTSPLICNDPNFRFIAFMSATRLNDTSDGQIGSTTNITSLYFDASNKAWRVSGSNIIAMSTFGFTNTANGQDYVVNTLSTIVNIDGFSTLFPSLTSITLRNMLMLSDISGLASSSNNLITTIDMTKTNGNYTTGIKSFECIKYFSSLTTINLSSVNGRVFTYTDGTQTHSILYNSASTLTQVYFTGNYDFSPSDIKAIADDADATHYNLITKLMVNNSNCTDEFETYVQINNLMSKTSMTSLQIAVNSSTAVSVAKTKIQDFIDLCNNKTNGTVGAYLSGINSNNIGSISSNVITLGTIGNYTATLQDPAYYKNNNYFGNGSSSTKNESCVVRIKDNSVGSNNLRADIRDVLITSGSDSSVVDYIKLGDNYIDVTKFSPFIRAYVANGTRNTGTTADGSYYVEGDSSITSITNNNVATFDISSLKGVEYLTNLNNISIQRNNNYKISELWASTDDSGNPITLTNLKTLEIESRALDESALAVIEHCPNLENLIVNSNSKPLDLLKQFSVAGVNGTCLAEIIASLSHLKVVSFNNVVSFSNYANSSVFTSTKDKGYQSAMVNMLSSTSVGNLFGYTLSSTSMKYNAVNGFMDLKLYVLSDFDKFLTTYYSYDSSSNYSNIIQMNNYSGTNYSSVNTNAVDSDNIVNMNNSTTNSTSELRYDLLPTKLNSSDILSTGVIFNLVTTFNFNGVAFPVSYSCSNTAYIVNNELVLNSTNYSNESSITLTISIPKLNKSFTLTIIINDNNPVTPTQPTTQSLYYIETSSGVYQDAFSVIASPTLVQLIFNGNVLYNGGTHITPVLTSTISGWSLSSGYVLTQSQITTVNTINISRVDTELENKKTTDYGELMTIDGIGIFTNLKYLTIGESGITNINALSTLSLIKFKYFTAAYIDDYDNQQVVDFSPLLNSKTTLTEFYYGYKTTGTRMFNYENSFAIFSEFTSLTKLALYQSNTNGTPTPTWAIIENESFNQLISYLYSKNSNLYITILRKENNSTDFTVDDKYTRANDEFNLLNLGDSLTVNNLVLKINSGNTANLESIINDGGKLYAVDWTEKSNISTKSIIFNGVSGKTYSYTIDGTAYNLTSGSTITYDFLQKLTNNINFIQDYINGEVNIKTQIVLSNETESRYGVRLNARIYVDDFGYDYTYILTK